HGDGRECRGRLSLQEAEPRFHFTRPHAAQTDVIDLDQENDVRARRLNGTCHGYGVDNDTDFGLAGAAWTTDVARAHRMAAQVNAGTFWVNGYKTINVASPFGGYGMSGYGRSSGVEALYEYTQTKSVWVETAEAPPTAFGYL
ncbi:aldehyde dehydrogenase family protein, partial [Burkholderia contaminans]|uniref:aldehyde dehydrogenase family protein n=1 Tax=Burkholderia contaminans TaxID=488447 RepID=UPI002D7F43B3